MELHRATVRVKFRGHHLIERTSGRGALEPVDTRGVGVTGHCAGQITIRDGERRPDLAEPVVVLGFDGGPWAVVERDRLDRATVAAAARHRAVRLEDVPGVRVFDDVTDANDHAASLADGSTR